MSDPETPFEPKASLRDLLSDEEFREILAPLPGDGEGLPLEGSDQVVLLLSEFPEDAEEFSAFLVSVDARVRPVTDRYLALDAMRSHQYLCFVMSVSHLGRDLSGYLERVRDIGSVRHLGFIADRDAIVPSWLEEEGVLIRRPLESLDLERFYSRLADESESTPTAIHNQPPSQSEFRPRHWDEGGSRSGSVAGDESHGQTHLKEPRQFDRGTREKHRRGREPNWLAAVRVLLEAQRSGESLTLALRRWAESDPACFGWGEVRDDGGELFVRAGGSQRAELVAALADEVTQQEDAPTHPVTRGEFSCLPSLESWTAFWWRDPDLGRRGWEQMGDILLLLEDLRGDPLGVEPISGAPRDRLLRLIDGRMHACRRHGGNLSVIALHCADKQQLMFYLESMGPQLRGEDYLEIVDGCIWILLDRTEATAPDSLTARLLEVTGSYELRGFGISWAPGGDSAEELVERLELRLDDPSAARGMTWLDN